MDKKMKYMNRRGIQKSGTEPGEGPLTEPAGGWQRPLNRGTHTHLTWKRSASPWAACPQMTPTFCSWCPRSTRRWCPEV